MDSDREGGLNLGQAMANKSEFKSKNIFYNNDGENYVKEKQHKVVK
jgi:hypothetical protein